MSDRKSSDKKYRQSAKGKANKQKWNTWQVNKKYYVYKLCLKCGQLRKIISKGLCDSCRKLRK